MAQVGIQSHSFITENSGSSASINATGDQICVSCPDDGVSKSCVVVLHPPRELQSTITYEIPNLVEEKCFHQEQGGEYTVAVFKQTMNKTLHGIPLTVSAILLMLLSVHVTNVLFLVRFNNTTGFYWSYILLLKSPILMC